jgi:hypothetical protein
MTNKQYFFPPFIISITNWNHFPWHMYYLNMKKNLMCKCKDILKNSVNNEAKNQIS